MDYFTTQAELMKVFNAYNEALEAEVPDEAQIREMAAKINSLTLSRDTKLAGICAYLKNTECDIEGVKTAIKKLNARKDSLEARAQRLEYLIKLAVSEDERWEFGSHSVFYRKSTFVDDHSISDIPECYWIPQPPKLDRETISKDLKAGADIPGARLGERRNLQVK